VRKIAESTVRRLSLYLRFLEEFEEQGASTLSSAALAARGGTTSAQVRKDLSFFGSFGKRGMGYEVPLLKAQLREILGLDRRYRVVVIGAGKIGSALVQYGGFRDRGFDLLAIYDNDPAKIGRQWNGLTVRYVAQLEKDLQQDHADIAAVVTPAEVAQRLAELPQPAVVKTLLEGAPAESRGGG
jgi:redox-sensing transcriptional repressor